MQHRLILQRNKPAAHRLTAPGVEEPPGVSRRAVIPHRLQSLHQKICPHRPQVMLQDLPQLKTLLPVQPPATPQQQPARMLENVPSLPGHVYFITQSGGKEILSNQPNPY